MFIAIRSLKVDQRCIPNSFSRFLDVFSTILVKKKKKTTVSANIGQNSPTGSKNSSTVSPGGRRTQNSSRGAASPRSTVSQAGRRTQNSAAGGAASPRSTARSQGGRQTQNSPRGLSGIYEPGQLLSGKTMLQVSVLLGQIPIVSSTKRKIQMKFHSKLTEQVAKLR